MFRLTHMQFCIEVYNYIYINLSRKMNNRIFSRHSFLIKRWSMFPIVLIWQNKWISLILLYLLWSTEWCLLFVCPTFGFKLIYQNITLWTILIWPKTQTVWKSTRHLRQIYWHFPSHFADAEGTYSRSLQSYTIYNE